MSLFYGGRADLNPKIQAQTPSAALAQGEAGYGLGCDQANDVNILFRPVGLCSPSPACTGKCSRCFKWQPALPAPVSGISMFFTGRKHSLRMMYQLLQVCRSFVFSCFPSVVLSASVVWCCPALPACAELCLLCHVPA